MGKDWIEFRGHYYKEKILVRRSRIEAIVEVPFDEKNNIGVIAWAIWYDRKYL